MRRKILPLLLACALLAGLCLTDAGGAGVSYADVGHNWSLDFTFPTESQVQARDRVTAQAPWSNEFRSPYLSG